MHLISIIVPVYNVEKYIVECIESIICQSYKNIEIILIDDGSTDKSGIICDEFASKDKRIIVVHKVNGGLSSARNAGIDIARGKYIIFVDSDDYWIDCDCLSKFIKVALQYDADIVRAEYKEVCEDGSDLRIKNISRKLDKQMKVLSSSEFYKWIVNGENFSVLFLFKKELFDLGLRFDTKRCFEEDVELNIRLFCQELRCVYMPNIFYAYRKRMGSIVSTGNINHLKDSFLLSDVFEEYSHITNDALLRQVYRENAVMMYYWTLVTIAEPQYYKQRCKIIKQLQLVRRKKKILYWANKYNVIKKSYIFNVLHPNLSVVLLKLIMVLRGFKL